MSIPEMPEFYWMVKMGSNDQLTITQSDDNYHICEKLSHLLSLSYYRLISRKESEKLFASKYKTVFPTEEELVRPIDADKEYLCEMRASYGAKYGEGS